ncbi:hypothetical protein SBA1_820031 [Candidatus Sulfotelmatobacter kueseliae]|uniref:Uncharacterized protein n=1 Tax=Candidatus Sulfotelmatobacter kueseliae TaxID=2042962 RepID=A0A2U3L8Z9_9BACT|nr:hypothetical protein SBA1_820031 [Candidatus Sulfotelmatobacter kueseliae]
MPPTCAAIKRIPCSPVCWQEGRFWEKNSSRQSIKRFSPNEPNKSFVCDIEAMSHKKEPESKRLRNHLV